MSMSRITGLARLGATRASGLQQHVGAVASQQQRFFGRMTGIPAADKGEKIEFFGTPHYRRKNVSSTDIEADDVKSANPKSTYCRDTYSLPAVNHIWTREEIQHSYDHQPKYQPKTIGDKAIRFLVTKMLYGGFNWVSGYKFDDPTPRSCAFRLILLESIAGIPGMVAGVCRHFTSLRTMRRDYGWIHTLFEEAQNERMHLLVCLKMFDAGILTRLAIVAAQTAVVPIMFAVYLVRPKFVHRFVGYLEETAVTTYCSLVEKTKEEGTQLNRAWGGVKAPSLAKAYWNMKDDAEWVDVLEQLMADEAHHRDVNHMFADMNADDPNPFIASKMEDMQKLHERPAVFKTGW